MSLVLSLICSEIEAEGVLDPSNKVDVFCLQVVFLPRINKCLAEFQGSWNSHPLSTEGSMSPLQLCVSGLIASDHQTKLAGTATGQSHLDLQTENLESVEVPCNKFEPCDELIGTVHSAVTPAAQATNDRKTMYHCVIQLVGQHLQSSCNRCKLISFSIDLS